MDRYLIESPHTAEDCDKVIKEVNYYRLKAGSFGERLKAA